jgi:hypothetical protein
MNLLYVYIEILNDLTYWWRWWHRIRPFGIPKLRQHTPNFHQCGSRWLKRLTGGHRTPISLLKAIPRIYSVFQRSSPRFPFVREDNLKIFMLHYYRTKDNALKLLTFVRLSTFDNHQWTVLMANSSSACRPQTIKRMHCTASMTPEYSRARDDI